MKSVLCPYEKSRVENYSRIKKSSWFRIVVEKMTNSASEREPEKDVFLIRHEIEQRYIKSLLDY